MESAYLTVAKISEMTGIKGETIRKWIREGKLPAYRPGGKVLLVERKAFESFVEQNKGGRE